MKSASAAFPIEPELLTGLLAGLGLYLLYQRSAILRQSPAALRRGHWLSILLISALLYIIMWPIAGLF